MPDGTDPTLDPNPNPDNPPAFDPSNLPPEVAKLIDQERTKASKTARANALRDAASDPTIVAQVRAALEEEARMTADERVAQKERELEQKELGINVKANRLSVEAVLIENGVPKDSAGTLAEIIATADEKVSVAKANEFVSMFTTALEAKVEAVKNELLANGGAPKKKGGDQPTQEEVMRAQYKEAMEKDDLPIAIHIQRQAAAQGITIQ